MSRRKQQALGTLWAVAALVLLFPCAALAKNLLLGSGSGAGTKDMFKLDTKHMKSVELQADRVDYSTADNKALAKGDVVVTADQTIMTCDQLEMDRNSQVGTAQGHVYIDSPQQQIDADTGVYNFNDQTGTFTDARIYNYPYQIKGKIVDRLSPGHIDMKQGYITTSDYDDPFFRIVSRKIDVYPGDKAIARNVKVYLGKVPVMYWPKYVQNLKDRPWITFTPGKSKDFGFFVLTEVRLRINNDARLTLHLDYREKKDFASGFDYKYNTHRYGSGIVRAYYMGERTINTKHLWQTTTPDLAVKTHERYKVEWRHKWEPDKDTQILVQYFRMRDPNFLKDYFVRQFRQDPNIDTYFLLTRVLPRGTLTFNINASRVNRYARGVEKIPEVRYDLSDTEIGQTGFYARTTDTFSDLVNEQESADRKTKTMRFDTINRVSYPMKISFVEFKPYAGGENTYYSRTVDLARPNIIRGAFFGGADVSTKFYRAWNVKKNLWGTQINGLRHVVTPSAAYFYERQPTYVPSKLNSFDATDSLQHAHRITFSLENKLQTKLADHSSLDMVRGIVTSDFGLRQNGTKGGFGPYNGTLEFKPNQWLQFRGDASYDHYNDNIASANFDAYINGGDKWAFNISRRYAHHADDVLTTEWSYKVNPKWKFKIYDQFILSTGSSGVATTTGTLKEEDYALTRDLHEWEMGLEYHQLRGGGTDFLLTFTLKAFPNMNLDLFSTGFHQRKAGSQSSP